MYTPPQHTNASCLPMQAAGFLVLSFTSSTVGLFTAAAMLGVGNGLSSGQSQRSLSLLPLSLSPSLPQPKRNERKYLCMRFRQT